MKIKWIKSMAALVVLSVCTYSCQHNDASANVNSTAPKLFDLKGYFEGEIKRLSSNHGATKTVTVNGQSETKVIDNLDIQKELSFFVDADINRPARSGKYMVDSLFNDKEILSFNYKFAIDEKDLKIKNIVIDFDKATVSKVYIESNASNSLTNSSQVLVYQPKLGYSIESRQKSAIGEGQDFKVEVKF